MTKDKIIELAKDIISAPEEFGGCLTIGADSIEDLHRLTEEMYKLGYECSFSFDTEKDWSMNIMYEKLLTPEEIVEAAMREDM